MSNQLMHGIKVVAQLAYFNNAGDLMKVIDELVDMTPEKDASIVNIDIAPQTGWQGETDYPSGNVILLEETLSDDSTVYNIEVY